MSNINNSKLKVHDRRLGKKPSSELSKKMKSLLKEYTIPILTTKTKTSYRTLIKIANGEDSVMQSVIEKLEKNIKSQKL